MSILAKIYPSQVRRFFLMKAKINSLNLGKEDYDFIQAMDVFSLDAGVALKKKINKPLLVDINELPNLKGRPTAANLPPFFKRLLNQKVVELSEEADQYITTCESLANYSSNFLNRNAQVIKNLNPFWVKNSSKNRLREELQLADDAFCLVFPATAAPNYGVEETIKALKLLPDFVKLIFVGRFNLSQYEAAVKAMVERENLVDRVFYKGPFYGDEYFEYLSGGDIAITPLSMKVTNHQYILPSRLLDMITAEIPIISTNIQEFFKLNSEIDIGFGLDHLHEQQIAKAVLNFMSLDERLKQLLKTNILKLKSALVKEKEQQRYFELVTELVKGNVKKAALICNLGIVNNKRLVTFCETLEQHGVTVDIYCLEPTREELRSRLQSTKFISLSAVKSISITSKSFLNYLEAVISRIYVNDVQDLFAKLAKSWGRLYRRIKPKVYFYTKNQLQLTEKFAQEVAKVNDFTPDVILLHDTLASKAGMELYNNNKNAHLVMDVTEIPDLKERISVELRNLSPKAVQKFVAWENSFIQDSKLIFTLNNSFKNFIAARYQRDDVEVVKNIRYRFYPTRNPVRFLLNLAADEIVVVFTGFSSVATCALPIIEAFTYLSPKIHLLFLSAPTNNSFRKRLIAKTKQLQLLDRVHFHEPIYGEQYLEILSSCDIGLVLFKTDMLQTKLVLPNRYLDFVAAGLPVLSSNVVDVEHYIHTYDTGDSIEEINPETIAQGIRNILDKYEIHGNGVVNNKFKDNALKLQEHICAENDFDYFSKKIRHLVKEVEHPKIAFLARQRLSTNTRIARQCKSLINEGCEVKLYGINEGPSEALLNQMGNVSVEIFDIV
jgi:glycosyltransferase involved in cell wall biosynthesis